MRRFTILALAVAIGAGMALSPFASDGPDGPDGLERVAQEQGFAERGRLAGVQQHAPAGDYAFPGVHDERLARGLAGVTGTLAVFLLGTGAVAVMRRGRAPRVRGA